MQRKFLHTDASSIKVQVKKRKVVPYPDHNVLWINNPVLHNNPVYHQFIPKRLT